MSTSQKYYVKTMYSGLVGKESRQYGCTRSDENANHYILILEI